MMTILCITICIMALLGAFTFHCSAWHCIFVAVISGILCIVRFFFFRKSKIKKILVPVLAFALLWFCVYIPQSPTEYGTDNYLQTFDRYVKAVEAGKDSQAEKLREELGEKYGETDDVRFMQAAAALDKGEIEEAEALSSSFENKKTMYYYMLQEEIIRGKYKENPDERSQQLLLIYLEAAEAFPEWDYVLKNAGGILFDYGRYEEASYYLTAAYTYEEEPDGETIYYLGASLIELGMVDRGLYLLNEALTCDIDDTMKSHILWYAEKAGWEAGT